MLLHKTVFKYPFTAAANGAGNLRCLGTVTSPKRSVRWFSESNSGDEEDAFRSLHLGTGLRGRFRAEKGLKVHSSRLRGRGNVESSQSICRRTVIRLKETESVEAFVAEYDASVVPAYRQSGLLGACIMVTRNEGRENELESQTFWTSTECLEANNASAEYQQAMQKLVRFLSDAPEISVFPMPSFSGFNVSKKVE